MIREWSLAVGHLPSPLVLLLLGGVLALAAYEAIGSFRRRRAGQPRVGVAILGLRLLALAAMFALAFELSLRVDSIRPGGQRLVVLVDTSKSMGLSDAADEHAAPTARHARATALWQRSEAARTAWAERGLGLQVRGFAVDATPWPTDGVDELVIEPRGAGSDLARALSELAEGDPGESAPIAGVVVVSDGLVARDTASTQHLEAVVDRLGVPITTVATGAPHIRDVAIAELRAGEFAFVENITEFEVELVAHGLVGQTATVDLLRDGERVQSTPLTLAADGVPRRLEFELAPDRTGQFVYEFRVRGVDGEATLENNRRAFVVKVLRDKVRVLHVAGRPDWDVRALRTLLRRDPNVELLSYYILRDIDDIERADDSAELSLIQFPTDELFDTELGSFDLVVLHNFDAMRHGVYHANFARYVAEGGALVLIGGDLGLGTGEYADADLGPLLPVDTREPAGISREPFRPRLTDAGRRHPITAWLAESGVGWDTLPRLDSFNPTRLPANASRIGATTLLEHPGTNASDGQPAPLLAVAEPGRGRTLVLATGATWRLGFAPELPLIDGARPYDLLWMGAVRWLLRDESSERLILETGRPSTVVGEAVELRARTLSASYAPEPAIEVEWEVRTLDDAKRELVASGRWTTDGLGRANETIVDLPVGAYEATARRRPVGEQAQEGAELEEARRVFLVDAATRELAQVDADPGTAQLRAIAERTGGEVVVADEGDVLPISPPLGDAAPSEGRVEARRDIPLWDGWLALAVIALAFGGEWWLRRRHGHA